VYRHYQRYIDDAYTAVLRARDAGRLTPPNGVSMETFMGQLVDQRARIRLRNWLRTEEISEGAQGTIAVNRWLRDPGGTNGYRIPDIRIPGARIILDGTIGIKTNATAQIVDFFNFSLGDRIIIVRPTQLGGSYGLVLR
jgi:hypothetical protein